MKIYAVFLGPIGFGVIAQINTFITFVTSTIHMGAPFSLSAILPNLFKEDSPHSRQKIYSYFRYFTKLFWFVSLVACVSLIFFSGFITRLILESAEYGYLLIILSLSIPFTITYSIFESILRSFGRIDKIVRISITTSLLGLLLLVPIVYYLHLAGAAISIAIWGALPFFFFIFRVRDILTDRYRDFEIKLEKEDKVKVFKLGLSSLISFVMFQLVIIFLRKIIILHFGLEENGIYQSVLAISLSYFMIIYSFLGNHTLPQLSMHSDLEVNVILDDTVRFLLLVIIPMVVLLLSYRDIIINLFFSRAFLAAKDLLVYQLCGDIFRMLSVPFSLWLFSRMRIKLLISIDFIFNSSLIILPLVFLNSYSSELQFVPISYMMASAIQFVLFFFYVKKTLAFQFSRKTLEFLALSVVVLTSSIILSLTNKYYGYISFWALMGMFFYIILRHIERVSLINAMRKIFTDVVSNK